MKFICTGSCGEKNPVNAHCPECSHANFSKRVKHSRGYVTIEFNRLHGPIFMWDNGNDVWPSQKSKLWLELEKLIKSSDRSCQRWYKKAKEKK